MINVIVKGELGVTLDNIPDSIFGVAGNINEGSDRGPTFVISEERREFVISTIRDFVRQLNGFEIVAPLVGGTLVMQKRAEAVAEEAPAAEAQDPDTEHEGDEEGAVDEEEEEENEENDFHAGVIGPNANNLVKLEEGSVAESLAASMENEISSNAKNLSDKIRNFNRRWTELLQVQREIDEATKTIQNNPLIKSLMEQVKEINEMENMVELAYFADGLIVIETKELKTHQRIGGHIKIVGRMRFEISLTPLIGSATRNDSPIKIKNLDRRFASTSSSSWECGHVPSNDSPCWGTAWPQLFSAFNRRELHEIIDILIRFISMPDPTDSWGSKIKGFPNFEATQTAPSADNENGSASAGDNPVG